MIEDDAVFCVPAKWNDSQNVTPWVVNCVCVFMWLNCNWFLCGVCLHINEFYLYIFNIMFWINLHVHLKICTCTIYIPYYVVILK